MEMEKEKWIVNIETTDSGKVHIYPTKGLLGFMYGPLPYYIEWVLPPDWIDKLLKHDFEWKIKRSINRTQEWCNIQNKKEENTIECAKRALKKLRL